MLTMVVKVFHKHGVVLGDSHETDWDLCVIKYYTRLQKIICDGKTVMLEPIHLNCKGVQVRAN